MKKFLVLSVTAALAAGFLFAPADGYAATVGTSAVKTVKTAQKAAASKPQVAVARTAARTPVISISRPKPIPPRPQPNYERLRISAPKPDEFVQNTFTVSGYAWRWFEGNIPTKVYDYNNTLLYDGFITASPVSYSAPTYFSKTITLNKQPTTDAGTLEFNDYSEKDGRVVYQKVVPVRFASFQAKPVITVLSPNGGETYQESQTIAVNWMISGQLPYNWDTTSRGIPDVSISLYQADRFIQNFTLRKMGGPVAYVKLPAAGSVYGTYYLPGNDFKIKISAVGLNNISQQYFDFSDNLFSITPKTQPVYNSGPTEVVLGRSYRFTAQVTKARPRSMVFIHLQRPDGTKQYDGVTVDTIASELGMPVYGFSGLGYTGQNGSWSYSDSWQVPNQGQTGTWISWVTVGGVISNKIYHQVTPSFPSPANRPPVITSVGGPTSLQVNETGAWTIKANDPDGQYLTYSIDWGDSVSARKGSAAAPVTTQTATFTHSYALAGNYRVVFTATDNNGAGAQSSLTVNVVSNSTPTPIPVPKPPIPPLPNPEPFSLAFSGSLADNWGRLPMNSNSNGIIFGNGWVGQAAKFSSSRDYAQYSCDAASFNQFQGTVGALVKFDRFTRNNAVIWQTNDSRFALYYNYASDNSEKRITARAGGEQYAAQFRFDQNYGSQRNTLTAGEWHYIAMVWSRTPNGPLKQGTVKLYIDGELKDAAQYQDAQNCSSFRVGNNYWPGLNFGDGWLDELSVRPQALSAEEVRTNYQNYNLPRPVPVPSGLTVSLAADNPVSMTVLSDSDANTYPQSQIPFLRVKFTAPAVSGLSEAVAVITLRFTRRGVSADNDFGRAYLVDENGRRLADYTAFNISNRVVLFSAPGGLFTVPNNGSRTITLMADLARASTSVTSGKTMGFAIEQASDIVASMNYKLPIAGSFPLVGNLMSTAAVSDLGHVYLTSWTTYPSFVPAGAANQELWRFAAIASSQDMEVRSIKLTAVGLINPSDLRNLRLEVNGLPVGQTIASLAPDKTVAFELPRDLSSQINRGQEKRFVLKGDIGNFTAGRVFKFTIQKQEDIIAYDRVYGVYNPVTITNDTVAWALVEPTLGNGTTIIDYPIIAVNKNTAMADRSASLPTGTVNAKNVQIGSFIITAGVGEESNITKIVLKDASVVQQLGDNFQNLKLMNGDTQIGYTIGSLDTSGTVATYVFIPTTPIRIPAGAHYIVDVYADIKSSPQDVGTVLSPAAVVDEVRATGVVSNLELSSPADVPLQNGYISPNGNLTITTASDTPVGQQLVMGANNQEVAKFKLSASVDEDIIISDIYLAAQMSSSATGTFSNIKLYDGSTQVGYTSNFGTISTGTYAVVPFAGLNLAVPKNSNKILSVRVDVSPSPNAVSGATATFALLSDYDGQTAGAQESIMARGASSGVTITGSSLNFGYNPDQVVAGNQMTVYATKISVAWSSDTPSGSSIPAMAQTVAKLTVSNADNQGYYSAIIKAVNLNILTSRISGTAGVVKLNLYQDAVAAANLVSTVTWPAGSTIPGGPISNVNFVNAPAVEIVPGISRTLIVTMDTANLAYTTPSAISISVPQGGIVWRDGVINSDITAVNSLPLSSKTLIY